MRLVPLVKRSWKLAGTVCLCLAAAACAGSSSDSNPFAKAQDLFAKPDWSGFAVGSKSKASTVVTAEDLIGADGSCAGMPVAPAVVGPVGSEGTTGQAAGVPIESSAPPANDPLLQPAGGIALGMSECEVARRAGNPERVDMGADDRGERSVVLTYSRGERAGIYRFREGRLFTIERVAVVEPEKPKKPVKTAKPVAKKSTKPPAAKPAQAAQGSAPAWPAPPQAQQPAQQQQRGAQSQVWPSPPPLRNSN